MRGAWCREGVHLMCADSAVRTAGPGGIGGVVRSMRPTDAGRASGEALHVRPVDPNTDLGVRRDGEGWRVAYGMSVPARQPDPSGTGRGRPAVRPIPKGWPRAAEHVWAAHAAARPPRTVLVAGAQGGVGTSTVAAMLAETMAACSPGPTAAVDQAGIPWETAIARALLGERAGLPGHRVQQMLRHGAVAQQILAVAPTSAAGTAILDDAAGYTPLTDLAALVHAVGGSLIVDGGHMDLTVPARIPGRPQVVVLVGRADLQGAQAVCSALSFLGKHLPVRSIVVLSSTTPLDRRRVHAARKLVRTAGVVSMVHLPFDAVLASGRVLRLDQIGKPTAGACLRLVTLIDPGGGGCAGAGPSDTGHLSRPRPAGST